MIVIKHIIAKLNGSRFVLKEVGTIKITAAELAERKDRIIHTAFRLFSQNGIDKVTMKEIADRAKVGEKSLYRYFNTKTELVMETVTVLWKEIVMEILAGVEEGYFQKSGYDQMVFLLNGFRNLFEKNGKYVLFSYDYKLFLIRHGAVISEDEYRDELAPIYEYFVSALTKGVEDGSIALDASPEDMYYSIWGLMRGYIVKIVIFSHMYGGKNPWSSRFQVVCNLILRGLRPS